MYAKRLIAASALAWAMAASFPAEGATATGPTFASPEVGMEVLDMMCVEQGGKAYNTPFTITRCQEARTRPGFTIEARVCEGLLGGRFASAPSYGREKRTTWTCSPGVS